VLIKDARIGDLVYSRADRTLWAVRHFNGVPRWCGSRSPTNDWNQVYSWPFGTTSTTSTSRGRPAAGGLAGEISGRQSLRLWKTQPLMEGDTTSTTLYDFGSSVPASFVFSPDGKSLYGSSYYTGVSNIFRWTSRRTP